MATWRYKISLLVLKKYHTHSLRSLVKFFSTLEEKFCISAQPCILTKLSENKVLKQILKKIIIKKSFIMYFASLWHFIKGAF